MDQLTSILQLTMSAMLGGIIGFERESSGKQAGFRTHALVSIASTLFTILSIGGFGGVFGQSYDPSRIASQVVVGIGFIGAGVIIFHENKVRGLTTAASLWMVAAIGMAIGMSMYAIAAFTTLLAFLILYVFRWVEIYLIKKNNHDD